VGKAVTGRGGGEGDVSESAPAGRLGNGCLVSLCWEAWPLACRWSSRLLLRCLGWIGLRMHCLALGLACFWCTSSDYLQHRTEVARICMFISLPGIRNKS